MRGAGVLLRALAPLLLLVCASPAYSASLYVSPTGTDGSACTLALPCQSFQRAYSVSQPGDEVLVAPGSYPGQNIDAAPKALASAPVVFRSSGGQVTIASFRVWQGGGFELHGMTITGNAYFGCNCQNSGAPGNVVRDVTFRDVKMRTFIIRGTDRITFTGVEVGPNRFTGGAMNWITEPYQDNDPPNDIVFERVWVHDVYAEVSDNHTDCIGFGNVDGFTMRNSRVERCQHFALIFGQDPSGRDSRNVLIEDNYLSCCDAPYAANPGHVVVGLGDVEGPFEFNRNQVVGVTGQDVRNLGGTVLGVFGCGNTGNLGLYATSLGDTCASEPPPPPQPTTTEPPTTTAPPPPTGCAADPAGCDAKIAALEASLASANQAVQVCKDKIARAIQRWHGSGNANSRAADMHTILHGSSCPVTAQ